MISCSDIFMHQKFLRKFGEIKEDFKMADSQPAGGEAKPAASERPLGPDGKPIPGPEQVRSKPFV